MKNIAVIGAGASGIMAALFAAGKNNKVVLFEKQKKIGRKILSTGNGRCNISNKYIDVSHYHGHNPKFILNVFSRFGLQEVVKYFESIGLPFIEEDEGRLFPASMQASAVVDILNYELHKKGVDLRLNRKIEQINYSKKRFMVMTAGKEEHIFDSVILAAGSCAYAGLGASNIGYELAGALGHKIHGPFPALLPIGIPLQILHTLEGVKWNCMARAEYKGRVIAESTGELLFTKYGISGPAALNISRAVNQHVLEKKIPEIIIDFFPELTEQMLTEKIKNLWRDPDKAVSFSIAGIIKKRIPEVLFQIAGIDPYKKVNKLTDNEEKAIIKIFKYLKLTPGNPRAFKEAVVAAGGIDVDEINPATMESRIIEKLYITGELLDIDGDSGGYNLQFAWSTGALAGMSQ